MKLTGSIGLVARVTVKIDHPRYWGMLLSCLSRISGGMAPITLPTAITIRKKGTLPGLAGLTRFSLDEYSSGRALPFGRARHSITFYTSILDRLSDEAVIAVMAHELAHAWLNEHVKAEASRVREQDADMLAEMWGFENELAALESETEPLNAV